MSTKEKERTARKRSSGTASAKSASDVVYMPPKTFNRNRFLLRLATVATIVIAVVLGVSVFFKVESVEVSGSEKYTAWDVRQASGIKDGENLLTFNRAKVSGRIISKLPYVGSVHIGIKLPGTVHIEIVEIEVTYAIKDSDGAWWLVSSGGKVVAKAADGTQEEHTKILGVELDKPEVSKQAVAKEIGSDQTDAEGNTVPVTVTQSQRLETALEIATQLENNGIIGKAASVDVTDYGDIGLWYGQQYQVLLGEASQLGKKISFLKGIVDDPDYPHLNGVLDITLTTQPDAVIRYPFGES